MHHTAPIRMLNGICTSSARDNKIVRNLDLVSMDKNFHFTFDGRPRLMLK